MKKKYEYDCWHCPYPSYKDDKIIFCGGACVQRLLNRVTSHNKQWKGKIMTIDNQTMNSIATYMVDDIREDLHLNLAPCSNEKFLNEYLIKDPSFWEILRNEFPEAADTMKNYTEQEPETVEIEKLRKPEIKLADPEKEYDWITVEGGEMSAKEKLEYLAMTREKHPEWDIKGMHLNIVNDAGKEMVDITCEYTTKQFERIRRITGYLVGDQRRFNDAKKAEVLDRVKHEIPQQEFEDVYMDGGEGESPAFVQSM